MTALQTKWAREASQKLKGRTITAVRYLEASELRAYLWQRSPVVLVLDDGTELFPASDDEGNDAGALFTTREDLQILPVI